MAEKTLTVEESKNGTVGTLAINGGSKEKGPVIRFTILCALIFEPRHPIEKFSLHTF